MGEGPTRPALARPGEADINLDELRHRISDLTKTRLRDGLNESEEREYDDLTRQELQILDRLN